MSQHTTLTVLKFWNDLSLFLFVSVIVVSIAIFLNKEDKKQNAVVGLKMEYAYYQGQTQALTNDIRVKFDTNLNRYVWNKSPWDDDKNLNLVKYRPEESLDVKFHIKKLK